MFFNLFEQSLYVLQQSKMLKENAQKLTSQLQQHPERFSFLPAPGHAEFWKSANFAPPLLGNKPIDLKVYSQQNEVKGCFSDCAPLLPIFNNSRSFTNVLARRTSHSFQHESTLHSFLFVFASVPH